MAVNPKLNGGMPIDKIPMITSEITPFQIDASRPIEKGFGSYEREVIAQAIVKICQERGSWRWAITTEDIKKTLLELGVKGISKPEHDLELQLSFAGGEMCCSVGDGRLLQKIATDTYAVTDLFIETCYTNKPQRLP